MLFNHLELSALNYFTTSVSQLKDIHTTEIVTEIYLSSWCKFIDLQNFFTNKVENFK